MSAIEDGSSPHGKAGPARTPPATPSSTTTNTPARAPAARRTPVFRPPFRKVSGSPSTKVHAPFKSPLRTSAIPGTSAAESSSGSCSTVQGPLKTQPAVSHLAISTRHKPYSLTPSRTHKAHSNRAGASETEESLRSDISRLREQIETTEQELEELSREYSEEEYQQYIDDLHEYNEVKDAAQILLGKLAEVQGTTVSELYRQFDLNLDD